MKILKSIIVALIVTSIGLGVMITAGVDGPQVWGIPLMLVCGLLAFGVNWLAFIPSAIAQTEKYYDLLGSITYLVTILAACMLSGDLHERALIVAAMVIVWTLRLGSFLFARISADGEDKRFKDIKGNPPRFFVTWTLQGAWVTLTAAAAFFIITSETSMPLGVAFYIGAVMWVIGFALEVIADNQKKAFKKDPENAGKFIQSGLWSWSRHPNYFGEFFLWTGIFVISIPLLSGSQWIITISPLFVYFLLTKVSGIPLLEKAGKKRWGDDPAYQAYFARTSRFFPLPPSKTE
ncbi:DUF1295 domain-containing protein [Kordiimonas sp. SCSIO 12610]|uniref:DUF1295 domain-containing protein n=1 Tax=Kordiimonas sp. SCSIO 12610 TaxID=2829597 RepID=UPI00210B1387|nr:DUF1295 domain-containing protein [Kordiimonas sp. SCSIO 12610]UTW54595.1 DUF1295 domain-containing protein [Kordiimonas sp. SCSIO 12610]